MISPFVQALLLTGKEAVSTQTQAPREYKPEEYEEPVPVPVFDLDLSSYDLGPHGPPNRKQRRAMSKKKKT